MVLSPVERIDASSIEDFEHHFANSQKPVVIAGWQSPGSPGQTWTMRRLVAEFGQVKVPVRETDDEFRVIFGGPGSAPSPRRTMMDLRSYVDAIERAAISGTRPPYAGNISLVNDPAVRRQFDRLLEDCRFPAWRPGNSVPEYRLWIGAAGQRSTIHNDPYHNFNAQIVGRKRFILFAPSQHGVLSAIYCNRSMWASPIDPLAPDFERYPAFANALGYDCTLTEGEVLFLPRFWFHYVEAVTTSVNVNFWVVFNARGDEWWHQQPAARPFVSYEAVLQQERARFQALPLEAQASRRDDFEYLEADLHRLMAQ